MSDIVLTTFNARYIHTAFGLRCLRANLGPLRERSRILEFVLQTPVEEAVERIVAEGPRVVGVGVSIWNVSQSMELIRQLRLLLPKATIVVGGPEVGGSDRLWLDAADFVVAGEGELAFRLICEEVIAGRSPTQKTRTLPISDLSQLQSPYGVYTDDDLRHRLTYVESTRGCPFGCEFCLSSRDPGVRRFPLEPFLMAMENLLGRGAKKFKFVDRTFNLDSDRCRRIMEFFLPHARERGVFLHFEVVPDRFSPELFDLVAQYPAGTLQLEVGVQSLHDEAVARIGRRQDGKRVEEVLRRHRQETAAWIHADLIVGLPGEGLRGDGGGFAKSFDRLVALEPQEIQVGILKCLRGTTLSRHDGEWGMRYSVTPPYEILENRLISREEMESMKRFARYWEIYFNSREFLSTLPMLWADGRSPFEEFFKFGERIFTWVGRVSGLSVEERAAFLAKYLLETRRFPMQEIQTFLAGDFMRRPGRKLESLNKCLSRNALQ